MLYNLFILLYFNFYPTANRVMDKSEKNITSIAKVLFEIIFYKAQESR